MAATSDPLGVVLLPGLNTTRDVWDPVIARMPADRTRQAFDCPVLDTVEAIADLIAAQSPPRFHLVGYSFGGYVSLALLERHAARIASLVMVASAAQADNDAGRAYRETCIRAAQTEEHHALNAAGAAGTFFESATGHPELVERYLAMARTYGTDRYVAHLQACLNRRDRTDVLENAVLPILFIAGEQDRVVSLRRQRESAEAARAEFKIIAGAGHQIPFEQPEALADAISAWLEGRL